VFGFRDACLQCKAAEQRYPEAEAMVGTIYNGGDANVIAPISGT
jgi:hypothetical protein